MSPSLQLKPHFVYVFRADLKADSRCLPDLHAQGLASARQSGDVKSCMSPSVRGRSLKRAMRHSAQ